MHEKGQEEFQRETGIDIERDIQYVVAAVTPGTHSALLVARGNFNPSSSRAWPSSTAAWSRPTGKAAGFHDDGQSTDTDRAAPWRSSSPAWSPSATPPPSSAPSTRS